MKTIAKFLLAMPLLAAFALSCQEKPQEPKESVKIEGIQETVMIAAAPEEDFSFTIETNVDWSIAKTGLDWLAISPMKGTAKDGVQTITLVADNNPNEETRTGSFTLTAGKTEKTFSVTQAALVIEPSFTVNGLEANTLSFGGEESAAKTFQVFSNKNWTAAKASLDWATVTPVEGEKGRAATITVTPTEVNTTGAERTGTISFSYGAAAPYVVTVKQAAFIPALTVAPESLSFSHEGEAKTVTVTSNTDWTAVSSETWATLSAASGKGDGTLTVTAAANNAAARTASVTITAGTIVKTVTLSQDSAPNFINLETNPVIWCADNQRWNRLNNPEFPGPVQDGCTGYVDTLHIPNAAGDFDVITPATVHGTGILKPMTETESGAIMSFVDGGGNTDFSAVTKGKFIFVAPGSDGSFGANGGDIGFRRPGTDDHWLFTVPSKAIAAGKTICFDFTFLGTKACPNWWAAEIKIGGSWVMMKAVNFNANPAAETVGTSNGNGAASNVTLLTPQRTNTHYDCTYAVTSAIPAGNLQIRLRIVDGSINLAGGSTSASDSNTIRFVGWSVEGRSIKDGHGPTIYVK